MLRCVLRNLTYYNKGCNTLNPIKNEILKISSLWMNCSNGLSTEKQEIKENKKMEEEETTTTSPQKTIIQMLAPRSKAITWAYEAFPRTLEQGSLKDVSFPLMNIRREKIGEKLLNGNVFNFPIRRDILHQVVRWQRAKRRSGRHKTKTRAEVSGGGRKPWRQKGTGRARQGSIRAPQWRGGGVVHGKVVRSHEHKLNRKVRKMGLKAALSSKAFENRLLIVDSIKVDKIKTKPLYEDLLKLLEGAPRISVLIADSGKEASDGGYFVRRSAKNIPGVNIIPYTKLTVYGILKHDILVLTQNAVDLTVEAVLKPIKR